MNPRITIRRDGDRIWLRVPCLTLEGAQSWVEHAITLDVCWLLLDDIHAVMTAGEHDDSPESEWPHKRKGYR